MGNKKTFQNKTDAFVKTTKRLWCELRILKLERHTEYLRQGGLADAAVMHKVYGQLRRELRERLTADTAGRRLFAGGGDDGYRVKIAFALRYRLEQSGALGAVGHAVGGVLNVAAGVDLSGASEQSGADPEAGLGGVGVFHRAFCGVRKRRRFSGHG